MVVNQDNDTQNIRAFGMNLDISNAKFNTIVHAVAVNENRKQFARRSIYTGESQANSNNGIEQSDGKYRLEKGFLGAHSDIGGGYESGDLSDTALMWIINQAEKSNVTIDRKWITKNNYHSTTNPVVHDNVGVYSLSQYKPSRRFLWAKDGKGISQFEKINHLKLNWKDTLQFESNKSKKFEKIKKYSKEYVELASLSICSRKDGTCPTRSATDAVNDYKPKFGLTNH